MTPREACRAIACALVAAALASAAGARTVRVGLAVHAPEVVVGATDGGVVLEAGEAAVARAERAPVRFGVRPLDASRAQRQWEVLIRVEPSMRKALLAQAGLKAALGVPLRVARTPRGHAVIAGPFASEESARELVEELAAAGMSEATLVPKETRAVNGPRLVGVTGGYEVRAIAGDRVRVRAERDGALLLVDGKPHRGEIEVFVDGREALTVALEIDVEDYLRGVVPAELGPEAYPALEAQQAQAIAARTYALRMLGRHAPDAFDLCAGPHCQVYGGTTLEQPLSDAAVAATRGRVVVFGNELAETYFSSTCGGHTEAVENVFDEPPQPYLSGVPCYPERVAFAKLTAPAHVPDWRLADGEDAHDVLAKLRAVGVVSPAEGARAGFVRRARGDEASSWLRLAAAVLGRTLREDALGHFMVDSRIDLVRSVAAATGLLDQGTLIAPQDLAAAARFRALEGMEGEDLLAALLALKAGWLPRGLEAGWGADRASRGDVLEILAAWLQSNGAFDVDPVRFVAPTDGGILVQRAGRRLEVKVAGDASLLAGVRGQAPKLCDVLDLKPGDKLRIIERPQGATYVALEEDPDGAAYDRTSAYSWWTRRLPIGTIAERARTELGLADVVDVRPTRVSPAGRVVGLALVDRSAVTREVTGFAVRQLLGLPDVRADLAFEHDASGGLQAIVATGRGWGHGVGLCQTGAYGMAMQGLTADAILAHYYPGTTVVDVSQLAPASSASPAPAEGAGDESGR